MQPVEEVGKGHGGDTDAGHLAVERFLVAQQQVGLQFGGDLMQRGQLQGLLLGDDPDRLLQVLQGIPDGVEVVVLDAVDGDPSRFTSRSCNDSRAAYTAPGPDPDGGGER